MFVIAGLGISIASSQAYAQPEFEFPFANPEKFAEQFMPGLSAEQRQAIAKEEVSAREEMQIGKQASDAYLKSLRESRIEVVQRGEDVEYLRKLVATIRPKMKNARRYRNIRVVVANSDKTDARSFPGGTLVFFRGIMNFAENEAALVGVIGHELSHLDRQHQLFQAKQIKYAQTAFQGNGGNWQEMLKKGMTLSRSFSTPFRPEEESEADLDGATWAYELGYDPREMAKLFLRMHKRDGRVAAGVPSFFRTHPFHIDRYQAILDRYNKLNADLPKADLYLGMKNLETRTPRSEREF